MTPAEAPGTIDGQPEIRICRKIPIIKSGLIFVQNAFFVGLFSGGLLFSEGLIIGRNFQFQKHLVFISKGITSYI